MRRALPALIRLATSLLVANRPRLIVLVAGSTAVALAASSIAIASVVSFATMRQTVAAGWRGPYDILVRPQGAPAMSLGDRRVVPINYLGSPTRGITRGDWQRIEQIPGVEVAAPVAALGWMKPDDASVGVRLAVNDPKDIYRIDIQTEVNSRVRATSCVLAADPATGVPTLFVGCDGALGGDGSLDVSAGLLPSAWGLVVGVDPIEEDKLVGLASYVEGGALERGVREIEDPAYGGRAIAVPVLTANGQLLAGNLWITVRRLQGVDPAAILTEIAARNAQAQQEGRPFLDLAGMMAVVDEATATAREEIVNAARSPLVELIQPLHNVPVELAEPGRITTATGGRYSAFGRNVLLVPRPPTYREVDSTTLQLDSIGLWTQDIAPRIAALQPPNFADPAADFGESLTIDDQIFRPLRVEEPPPFVLQPVGTYDLPSLSARYNTAVNYAPLGIYGDAPRRQIAMPNGEAVDDVLPGSLNPGGVNPLPPVGLTNLEAVEALRGSSFIDAVRVRVAGVSEYSPAAVQKIEDVASAIRSRTGLDVIVVAGSSTIDLDVEVPGLGTISERWTTLGEAPRIERATGGFSGFLLWVALLVVALYLVTFGLFLVADQAGELAVLRLIGWRRRDAIGLLMSQATVLGVSSGVLGCLVTLGVGWGLALNVPAGVLAAVGAGTVLAHLGAAGLIGAWQSRRPYRTALRGAPTQAPRTVRAQGTSSLAFANALDSRLRVVGLTVALGLAVALANVVIGLQFGLQGRLRTTLLGQLVAVRVGPYHVLAAAAAMFAAGAMATNGAILAVERRLAVLGLLRAVGWSARDLHRLIRLEIGIPGLIAGAFGAIVTLVSLLAVGISALPIVLLTLLAVVAAPPIALLAAQPAMDLATRVAPGITLRAEGASGLMPGFTGRSALVAVGTFGSVAIAASIAWSVIQPPGIPVSAVVATPTPLAPTQSEVRVEHDIEAIAAQADRHAGTATLAVAQAYVRDRLEAAGYRVTQVRFLVRTPTLLDVQGAPVDRERQLSSVFPVTLAYDSVLPDSGDLRFRDLTFVDATRSAVARDCPAGLVLLRVGIRVGEYSKAEAAAEFQTRCAGRTAAVLGVTAPDADWAQAPAILGEVRLPVATHLIAESQPAPGPGTPWLIAALDADGPGATQSAAPSAVALEVARLAAERHAALRLAFTIEQDGAAASSLIRYVAQFSPGARVVTLGPMGGPVATTLGSTDTPAQLGPDSVTAALLATVSIDADSADWLATARQQARTSTGADWLTTIAAKTELTPTGTVGLNVFALAAGLDAAFLGEDPLPVGSVQSIAGTAADTPDQVDIGAIARLATAIAAALSGGAA